MADDADIASRYMDDQISRRVREICQNMAVVKLGPKECKECGECIPEDRRKLGFQLCVECAEENERRNSLFADY